MTMYLEHFGLREAPFRITPHTEFFFAGANRGATLEALLYAITAGEGMVKVTGEVGSGKTMLCRVLMERLPESVETIYLAVPSLTRDEMLAAIASDLSIETAGANTTQLVRALQERLIGIHAEGRQVVALIDEAHAMPLGTLEEIRLLSNLETGKEKLLQIVLFGQPELDQHLSLPHMRQLKERITHSFNLAPLPAREVRDYLAFRLRAAGYRGPDLFTPEALRIITEASEGLTRRINIYADKTLLAAFAAGTHSITGDHARAAVADTQIVMTRRDSPRRVAGVAAACLVLGTGLGFAVSRLGPGVASVTSQANSVASAAQKTSPAATVAQKTNPAATAAALPAPAAIPVAATAPAPARDTGGAPAPSGAQDSLLARRLAAGRALLDANSAARYAVQLMATDAREHGYLEGYLAEAGQTLPPAQLFVVPLGASPGARVAVLYGSFHDRAEANAALVALPPGLRQFRPYVRPIAAVREDARRTQRG